MSLDLRPTQAFLRDLAAHNDKEWFATNKKRYERDLKQVAVAFCREVEDALHAIDPDIVVDARFNGSIFRMNRDLRFSTDKRPYRDWLGFRFWTGDKKTGGSAVYFRVMPEVIGVATGIWAFDKDMREGYRQGIAGPEGEALVTAIDTLVAGGAHVTADSLARVPKPWDDSHPRAAWLKHKGLVVGLEESPELGPGVVDHIVARWQDLSPVHHFLRTHCG